MSEAQDAFSQGMDIRRQMWGSEGAERRVAAASDFNRPLEDLVTRVCFGEVWTRPGIDHKTRSMLTLAILASIGGVPNQLRTHVRGAIANGVSPEEIREVLLHVMAYAGVPRAADAFGHARETLQELGLDK
jgi:4-carboxymuconolactone decarboxylase